MRFSGSARRAVASPEQAGVEGCLKKRRDDRPTTDASSELERKLDALLVRKQERVELPPPSERRALRKALGLTLQEVAELVGCSHVAVVHWEKGQRTPQGGNLTRYRELLDALRDRGKKRAKRERRESSGSE